MFPLCHIYFANKVLADTSRYTILGSIYPDVVVSKSIKRDETHNNTRRLYEFLQGQGEEMEKFALGALTHGVDLMGLDYYSDESYPGFDKGFCFEKGKDIAQGVIECLNIPEEWGLWKAHNFIEMAFEVYLYRKNKWLVDIFKDSINHKETVSDISHVLQDYYKIPAPYLCKSFEKFAQYFSYSCADIYFYVENYAIQLEMKHNIFNVNKAKAREIMAKAIEIVEETAQQFFDYTLLRVGDSLREFKINS